MHKKYLSLVALFFGIIILVIISLTARPLDISTKESVAASIFPIYDIAQNIAGDEVDVQLVLPAGASPHTFAPSPSDIRGLQNADVLYTIGAGLDDWSSVISESLDLERLELASFVVTIEEEEYEDGEDNHEHGDIDPHYWLSIENALLIAESIRADLSERYPESREVFQKNFDSYALELEETKIAITEMLADLENRNILTFHNSFAYFAQEYDLNIVGSFEPTAGREPSPQELVQLTGLVEELNVKIIYSEPQLSIAPLESFLQDNNLEAKTLDPLGGSLESLPSYINLMLRNAQVISQN